MTPNSLGQKANWEDLSCHLRFWPSTDVKLTLLPLACEETTRIFFKHKGLGNAPRFRIRIKFESMIQNYTELSEMKDGTQPIIFQGEESLCQEGALPERKA